MNKISVICVIALMLNSAQSLDNGNCHLEGVTSSDWITRYINEIVSDTERKEFKRFQVENITGVKLQGVDYGKYFDAEIVDNYLIIKPSVDFQDYERDENSHFNPEMMVYLVFDCADGYTKRLAFYQPIKDTNTYTPTFNRSSYIYKLPMPLPANFSLAEFGDRIEACDSDISNTRLHFTIISSEQLSLAWEKPTNSTFKCHLAILKTKSYLRLKEDHVYEISVTDTGVPSKSRTATLHIHIDTARSIPPNPSFEKKFYWATYSDQGRNHIITVNEPIRLENYDSTIKFDILGVYKDKFDIQVVSEEILIRLKENLPTDILLDHKIFILIEAVRKNAEEQGVAVLYIDFPKACRHNGYEITEIALANLVRPSIQFDQDDYWFKAPNHKGQLIGIVTATAFPEQIVKYSMEQANNYTLPEQIGYNETTGWITLKSHVPAGLYGFIAIAEGCNCTMAATANVVITIFDDNVPLMTIVHIKENASEYVPIPCPPGANGCEYEVVDQYPSTSPVLFDIRSGYLHNTGIDREMELLENMALPQFMVRLRLKACQSSRLISTLPPHQEVNREWALVPTNIATKPGELLVVVIIDDVNDNPPIFDCGDSLVIGYPTIDLLPQIAPSHVAIVHATDYDVGINADIKYTINSKHFTVHARSGVIYPKTSAFGGKDNLKFAVRATDLNGDTFVGLSSELQVEVKLLEQKHLAVLTIGNSVLEELTETVQKLSDKTNLKIRCLTASVIPNAEIQTYGSVERAINGQYFLSAVIYAMDTDFTLVTAMQLKRAIEGTNVVKNFAITNWESSTYEATVKSNTFYFIITIGILISLLMILIVAIAICYCFRIYKKRDSEQHYSPKIGSIEESEVSNSSTISLDKASNITVLKIVENNEEVINETVTVDDDKGDKTAIRSIYGDK